MGETERELEEEEKETWREVRKVQMKRRRREIGIAQRCEPKVYLVKVYLNFILECNR